MDSMFTAFPCQVYHQGRHTNTYKFVYQPDTLRNSAGVANTYMPARKLGEINTYCKHPEPGITRILKPDGIHLYVYTTHARIVLYVCMYVHMIVHTITHKFVITSQFFKIQKML